MSKPEKWDLFDENRKPLDRQHTRGFEMIPGEYHTVVGIWVVNDNNEILLTLRHPDKEDYPGLWENTGGSVLSGETSRQGAARELYEETGIEVSENELAYLGTNREGSAFIDLYAVRKNIEISGLTMQEGETAGAQWVTSEKLDELAAGGEIAEPIVRRLTLLRTGFDNFLHGCSLKQKKYILFDLDGTVTDSATGIINSVVYALEKLGIDAPDRSTLYSFVGPPLWDSFEKNFNLTRETADTAVKYFREYYSEKGVYENEVYRGVENLLRLLKDTGKIVVLATSKAEFFAEKVLEHFDLKQYFSFIAGSKFDGTRIKKDEVISYALEECGIDARLAVMIGDREHDVDGAIKNSLDSIGVLYGYGDMNELQSAGAMYLANNAEELAEQLVG